MNPETPTSDDDRKHSSRPRNNTSSTSSNPRPWSSHATNQSPDIDGGGRGPNFKPSGFAYARPLTLAQLQCYQDHARLTLSSNRAAPVECAICHLDDHKDHWSCSWCAVRMCGSCRADFARRGLIALREKISLAESVRKGQGLDGNGSPTNDDDSR